MVGGMLVADVLNVHLVDGVVPITAPFESSVEKLEDIVDFVYLIVGKRALFMHGVTLYSDRLTRTTAVDKVSTSDNTPPTM